ncbi:MAG: acyl-ACP--UDP-N-acetylglucosamine O-acyltransferase [Candidatus Oxydemutatoraceae bacterium WSBS_2016_MAG_OTU14]
MPKIHKDADIDPSAELGDDVIIGRGSVIGANVKIGAGTRIREYVVVRDNTEMGCGNDIFQFASIGEIPQDKKYRGEKAILKMGDNNTVREFCTLHSGTNTHTAIGSGNLMMAYVHIAHDCLIGNDCIFVNNAALAGHVLVDDHAVIGSSCKVHQFCRVGEHAFTRHIVLVKDLAPYVIAAGTPAKTYGINKIGLERAGFSSELIEALGKAYRIMMRKGEKDQAALQALSSEMEQYEEVRRFVTFIQNSERGVLY